MTLASWLLSGFAFIAALAIFGGLWLARAAEKRRAAEEIRLASSKHPPDPLSYLRRGGAL